MQKICYSVINQVHCIQGGITAHVLHTQNITPLTSLAQFGRPHQVEQSARTIKQWLLVLREQSENWRNHETDLLSTLSTVDVLGPSRPVQSNVINPAKARFPT